jgi:diguanylate cyclase (GGDEF)-like protein
MVREDRLSAVLSEFARTLATDFPIQRILDHLVERIVEVLPVTAAGVTLITEDAVPRYIAASDDFALRCEQLQTDIGQGPCLSAYESGQAVAVPDLSADARFPQFADAAVEAGLAAVFTFPLRHSAGLLGALDLYQDQPGLLPDDDMGAAQTLADVAAAYLVNARAREDARVAAEHFRHAALHDSLTGLGNRLMLQQQIEYAVKRATRSHAVAAILFCDLDRFKQVNDSHGHQVGDDLLRAVAHRLSGLVRPGDTLARFSGDEFVFLCEDLKSEADAEVLAGRIGEAFGSPFVLPSATIAITASVGVAFSGPGDAISAQLLVDADVAMYQAKRRGGAGHQVFDLREARQTIDRNSLEASLRSAFADDQLEVHYQPVVRCSDGTIIGAEALMRWMPPDRGPVSALSMVAVAEASGLIVALGAWVMEQACRDRAEWLRAFPRKPVDLAVNVSARQLMSKHFCATVAGVLERTAMDPTALVLEITENLLIEDTVRALSVLAELKEMGVRLALDDFGTGYSSLSYLRRMPIDIVKIDQGFIAEVGYAPAGDAIVAAVTDLAHALGLTITAEGVETERQHQAVRAMGCDCAQGYRYARPMPAAAFATQLSAASASI